MPLHPEFEAPVIAAEAATADRFPLRDLVIWLAYGETPDRFDALFDERFPDTVTYVAAILPTGRLGAALGNLLSVARSGSLTFSGVGPAGDQELIPLAFWQDLDAADLDWRASQTCTSETGKTQADTEPPPPGGIVRPTYPCRTYTSIKTSRSAAMELWRDTPRSVDQSAPPADTATKTRLTTGARVQAEYGRWIDEQVQAGNQINEQAADAWARRRGYSTTEVRKLFDAETRPVKRARGRPKKAGV